MDVNDVRIRTGVILQKKKHSASDAQTVNYVVNGLKNEKNLFWVILFYKAHSVVIFNQLATSKKGTIQAYLPWNLLWKLASGELAIRSNDWLQPILSCRLIPFFNNSTLLYSLTSDNFLCSYYCVFYNVLTNVNLKKLNIYCSQERKALH